ncbi:anti-sigma-D factor RsdA [Williamsia sp. CHRR-6]|uniref:anti-sigma-D factor RsdA n=1 Tax=Williamsia sp. CHRR-6 TaxID=2835871 RepID=UPI001BD9BCA0|nr:anti-sigma-D factor RsdA [Williamsia sp. CHRR-6]MBT0566759.1 hypothetical protein [Williamsia sp. CHRR-6]
MTGRDRKVPFASDPDGPSMAESVDFRAVRADDELIDALSRGQFPRGWDPASADHQVATLLAGWRQEIDATAMPTSPTLAQVEAALADAEKSSSRRGITRRLQIVAGAAAIGVIAFGGLTVVSQGAQPGDPLYGIKEFVFGADKNQSVVSASVQSDLEQAEQALSVGDKRKAAELLVKAQTRIGELAGDDSAQRMQDWVQRLAGQVGSIPNNPLTSLSNLPSVSGLPPLQVPPQVTGGSTSPSPSPSQPATTPSAPSSTSSAPSVVTTTTEPSETTTTTTTTTTTPAPRG